MLPVSDGDVGEMLSGSRKSQQLALPSQDFE